MGMCVMLCGYLIIFIILICDLTLLCQRFGTRIKAMVSQKKYIQDGQMWILNSGHKG